MLSHTLHDPGADAPIILYLHGLGVPGWCWEPTVVALPEFCALVPDLPGHGESHTVPWDSIEKTAVKVCEIVDTLPPERAVYLVGHSLGAYVGMNVLTQRPARFTGAVLSGFHLGSTGNPRLLKLAYVLNGMMFRLPWLLRRFGSVFGDATITERFVASARTIRSRTIRRAGIQVVDFETPAKLEDLTLPILAIAGSKEPGAIRTAPKVLAGRLADVEPVVLDGRDHLWPMKEPELFTSQLRAFVEGQDGAR